MDVPKPLGKLRPPGPTVVQSHSETVYPRPICQLFDISESTCPEYPQSQHKYPECPAPAPQRARHNLLRGGNSASEVSSLWSTGGMNSEAGNGGSGDVGTGGGKCSDDGGGGSGGEGI
ncbi:hypothetical protein Tco_1399329 [Tanacetum coccineum]